MNTSQKLKHLLKALLSTGLVITAGLLNAALAVSLAYADRLLPGTHVAGRDLGGLTLADTTSTLDQQLPATIDLTLAEQTISAEPLAVGVTWPTTAVAKAAFTIGHSQNSLSNLGHILKSLFVTRNFDLPVEINEEVLNTYVDEKIGSLITEPIDATLAVVKGQITLTDDQAGLAIDLARLKQDLKTAVLADSGSVAVNMQTQTVAPAVTKADLSTYKELIEGYAAVPVVVTANNQAVTLTAADTLNWYTLNRAETSPAATKRFIVTVDEPAVAASVAKIAKQVEVKAVSRQVTDTGAVLVEGSAGSTLDRAAVTAALVAQAKQVIAGTNNSGAVAVAATMTVTPPVTVTVASNDQNITPVIDTEAKFIQINLAKQKMYLFENRQLINVFAISSGKAGYETPKGVHKIYNKARRPLSGAYGMYLPYWNAITADGKYGIHELPEWPNGYKEGESHLGRAVSHGCMRLGVGSAAYVYEWAPIGTAVVVQ